VVENGNEALLRKIKKMEQLRDHVLNLREKGLPPHSIRQEVLGKEDAWNLITGGHYSKQNTIDSILSGKRPDREERNYLSEINYQTNSSPESIPNAAHFTPKLT
jgi:hypothetical protein